MDVKYILTAKYANGDDYADKFDDLYELAEQLRYIDSSVNGNHPDAHRILSTQITVTTEEQI